jgi:hypothetical protein
MEVHSIETTVVDNTYLGLGKRWLWENVLQNSYAGGAVLLIVLLLHIYFSIFSAKEGLPKKEDGKSALRKKTDGMLKKIEH